MRMIQVGSEGVGLGWGPLSATTSHMIRSADGTGTAVGTMTMTMTWAAGRKVRLN